MNSEVLAWVYKHFYCRLIGTWLPAHWFGPRPPDTHQLSKPTGRLKVEIVSHCWQYAHLSVYQLSSLVNHPPTLLDLTYTLFYSPEDKATNELVKTFAAMDIPNVRWQWREMPRMELFRRAIGRNRAAMATKADWIWFTDCDLIFHAGCLDSLANALESIQCRMVFPAAERVTDLLPADHPLVNLDAESPQVVDIDPELFRPNKIQKAKGAFQIAHGDVARKCGYCKELSFYQRPTQRWRKAYEDTAFRRVISDSGRPVPVTGLHRIRHQEKGRYSQTSRISGVRQSLRQISDQR